MRRTLLVILVALTVLVAGCGGPGDAPEDDEETPEDESDDPAEEDSAEEGEEENETGSIGQFGLTVPSPG